MFTMFETPEQELEYRRAAHRKARRSLWKTRALLVGVVVGVAYLSRTNNEDDNESK
jgi:hypothetical protein